MADSNVTKAVPASSPQSLDVEDILRVVEDVANNCRPFLFPARRIPCKAKSAAERRQITKARIDLYERSAGVCELRLSPKCLIGITFETMHTCHVISRSRGGTWDLENLKAGCLECHIGWEHNGGKPCPPKSGGAR